MALAEGFRLPISPDRWGGVFWDTLHFVSLGYPDQNPTTDVQRAARNFLEALPFLLPCQACRDHLASAYQNDMPLTPSVFASRQSLGEYIVRLRDLVHRRHVCPRCTRRSHRFPDDVADRLLGPSASPWATWLGLTVLTSLIITAAWGFRKAGPWRRPRRL